MSTLPDDLLRDGSTAGVAAPGAPAASRPPNVWTRPVSYRAQCWIAWTGLTAFAVGGLAAWRATGAMSPEQLVACVLAPCWGLDLLRARSTER